MGELRARIPCSSSPSISVRVLVWMRRVLGREVSSLDSVALHASLVLRCLRTIHYARRITFLWFSSQRGHLLLPVDSSLRSKRYDHQKRSCLMCSHQKQRVSSRSHRIFRSLVQPSARRSTSSPSLWSPINYTHSSRVRACRIVRGFPRIAVSSRQTVSTSTR